MPTTQMPLVYNTLTTNPVCIYHSPCADGYGAAWSVWRAFPNVELVPATYGDAPPENIQGRDVIIVDFSYPHDVIMAMAAKANSVLVIDHHKTAQKNLEALPNALAGYGEFSHKFCTPWEFFQNQNRAHCAIQNMPNVGKVFDMKKSGAMLTWEFFHGERIPWILDHIQDGDLWKHELPNTPAIMHVIYSYAFDVKVFDDILAKGDYYKLVVEGSAIKRRQSKDCLELIKTTKRKMVIGSYLVPVANMPYMMASQACSIMCGQPFYEDGSLPKFAASYFDRNDNKRIFSLRSTSDFDVSEIAKGYGGGGHNNAAGFSISLGDEKGFAPLQS